MAVGKEMYKSDYYVNNVVGGDNSNKRDTIWGLCKLKDFCLMWVYMSDCEGIPCRVIQLTRRLHYYFTAFSFFQ